MAGYRYAAASILLATTVLAATVAGCAYNSAAPSADASSAASRPRAAVTAHGVSRPSTSTPPAHPSRTLPTGATVQTLRVELSAPSNGVELYPVAARGLTVVAPATIYATMMFANEPELKSHPSTIELATYRSALNGGRIDLGDGVSPHFVHSLVAWAIIYAGITPVWPDLGGPYRAPGAPTPSSRPTPTDCQWVYLANAVTGRYVSAFGGCPGELRPVARR